MKLFRKKDRHLYLVLAYWARPKAGEVCMYRPLIRGIYKDIERAKKCVEKIKSMRMYAYVTYVSITTDL